MRYCEVCRASFQATSVCPRDKVRLRADIDDPLLDRVLGGRFRVLERIAAGGMGQIYRATHTRIATLVVVKVLYGELTHVPEMRARFQREAEAASCLQSRHIVRVLDFGESDEGLLYLAMEQLRGPSLSGVLGRDGALGAGRAVSIARQVLRGLSHAHERGIVHRDLKPDNVMLVREDDEDDVVKLLDFGIAQIRAGSRLTTAGQFMGTPHYMAPEQFAGGDVDARADLYSLGVMLYETLTGAPPFDAPTIADLARAHAQATPPRLASRRAEVTPELESVVHRLLAKAPAERYASAREAGEALRQVGEPRATAPASRPVAAPRVPTVATEVVEPILAAIQRGAPLYNSGDHAGCADLYRSCAEAIIANGPRGGCQVAVAARLRAALGRAAALSSPTHAAWELRYAFDDLLHAASATIDASVTEDPLEAELAIAQAIAASRYAANDFDAVAAFYLETARGLSTWLRIEGREAPTAEWLGRVASWAETKGGGRQSLTDLSQALGTLHKNLRGTGGGAFSSQRPAPSGRTPMFGGETAWADEIARRIAVAVGLGAPAYNAGDVAGCLRVYRQTASELLRELASEPTCAGAVTRLRAALEEASQTGDDAGAWALRRAFDELADAARASRPLSNARP